MRRLILFGALVVTLIVAVNFHDPSTPTSPAATPPVRAPAAPQATPEQYAAEHEAAKQAVSGILASAAPAPPEPKRPIVFPEPSVTLSKYSFARGWRVAVPRYVHVSEQKYC